MKMDFGGKLRQLRKDKNISQEKLAQYLNVSFQAVSKWENNNTCPDIALLPEIARFFGITVDELLQAEHIDEKKLFAEYESRAAVLYRNGHIEETIPIWQEAYHRMPNNIAVSEMLMSAYFDTDHVKYQKEIVGLATEIYHSSCGSYYKGQAISTAARTYAECGDFETAGQWTDRAHQLMHSMEMLVIQTTDNGAEMLENFRFANYWYISSLFYMSARLAGCDSLPVPDSSAFIQSVEKAVAALYELVFPDDDMSYEDLKRLCVLHRMIAEDEAHLGKDENTVRYHLTRAAECAEKSAGIKAHDLTHPLVRGLYICDAPEDNKQILRILGSELSWSCFDEYRSREWFRGIADRIENMM